MARILFNDSFNSFLGAGLNDGGLGGALDSNFWTVTDVSFGTATDLARGVTTGGVSTGGLYALDQGAGDYAVYVQPAGSDWTPGELDLTFNTGTEAATGVSVSFDRIINNNATRGNTIELQYSVDGGVTFLVLDTFTSAAAADTNGVTETTVTVGLPDLPANTDVILRWALDDATGSGSRDEFGIDNVSVTADDDGGSAPAAFTLELLHFADQEAAAAAVADAPNLSAVLNALQAQDLGNDGLADNTLILSSGDAIIPGLFFDASASVFGAAGIADIQIQNELGVQAMALGNHEFDLGTRTLSELITGQDVTDDSDIDDGFIDTVPRSIGNFDALTTSALAGQEFGGTEFSYLSANLDFSTDGFTAPLEVEGGQAPQGNTVSSSVVIDTNGENIGVVGATTPTLDIISSPGDVGILPGDFDATPTSAQLDALAAEIQDEVDMLLANNPDMNKVILLAHMQQLDIELGLAARLENVDVIVAGGSNTRLFDDNDIARDGDSDQGQYPQFVTNAGGTTTAVVNTDGSYKYVGRLVIDFDENGNVLADSYDADVSGAYATDDAGVARLGAESLIDPEIQAIADAIEAEIIATESNVFGGSDVFLNGNRSGVEGDEDGVRTQETNLGNLTADANLAAAQAVDSTVVVSIKNGGGIRASIGEDVVLPGDTASTRLPNGEVVDGDGNVIKPAGGISQNDISTTLAFNNDLSLMTLTKAELVEVLEYGVAAVPGVSGRFPQVSGIEFSFDPDLPEGSRIVNAEIVAEDGSSIAELVRDGAIVGDATESFRIVTLNFLAGGGDGYPFPQTAEANRIDLTDLDQNGIDDGTRDGAATFADTGTEQDALAEYLTAIGTFTEADTTQAEDTRIQNLNFRADTIFDAAGVEPTPFQESFEDAPGDGYTLTTAFDDGGFDYFDRYAAPDNSNGARDDFQNGFDGAFAIHAQDLDGEGGPATQSINIDGIDIAGFDNPAVTLALGALFSTQFQNYEGDDGIKIYASVDGGDDVLVGAFAPDATSNLALDSDLDGIGDGTQLTADLADFTFSLPEGSSLDLRIDLTSNASFEPLVVDNVRVDEGPFVADPIYVESFEEEPGTTYTIETAFDDGGFDYFNRYAAPDGSNGARDDFQSGFDGEFAIFAQDLDGEGGPATQSIKIDGVDLTGYAAPTVTIAVGANFSTNFQNWEGEDGVKVIATLDGGAEVVIGAFAPDATNNLALDSDLDGVGDGPNLTADLADFTFDLPAGDVLDLRIDLTTNASFESLAIDFVRIGDDSETYEPPVDPVDGSIDDPATLISAIQGTEDEAALVGETVVVEGYVTGDFQNGDADDFRSIGGFFVQEEAADQDGDAATSEGIFIYEGDADTALDINAGDKVRVLGNVVERFGKTTIELAEIQVVEAGAVDPLSLAQSITLPDVDDREAVESMLVTIDEELTFTESFDYEEFGELTMSTDGVVYQYTQLNEESAAGNAAYQAEVANRLLTVDNGTDGSRADFDPITEPDGDLITDSSAFRMGQTTDSLTGIMDYGFSDFRLRMTDGADFALDPESNVLPDAPLDVGSDYKVATLNVLNYFTTLSGTTDIGGGPRGATSLEELDRQTDKLVEMILGLDADVIGLVELENDFEGDSFAVMELVGEINARLEEPVYDFVYPGQEFVGDDVIAVGFIYDTTTTALVGDAAILDTQAFQNPLGAAGGGDTFNRAALAQTFEEIETGGVFTASVNHFKSKGSLTGAPEDNDQGDGAGNNNATRTAAAIELADWLASDPTGSGDEDVLILGDLNAYAKESPIQALNDAGYTDLAAEFEGEDVYSFRFSGQIGTLDYILSNESMTGQVTGADTWHANSDTPVIFDYNLDGTFTDPLRPTDQGLFDGTSPERASDHDPLVIGLDLAPELLVIAGDEGRDRLVGTDADELIISGGGRLDTAAGLGGADTFQFTDIEGQRDYLRILDFNAEEDTLDLAGASIASVRETRSSVRLTLEDDRDAIVLTGVTNFDDITIIGTDEFVFA
ncbi:MAG: ExeM/NucH family extracellular endonuclease [Pseudomonadota bacterium]